MNAYDRFELRTEGNDMLSIRSRALMLWCATVVASAGCSRSVELKQDPWQEYLTAQEVWKNERDMLEEYERLHQTNPTADEKAIIENLKARFEKASAHIKAVRERLPEK